MNKVRIELSAKSKLEDVLSRLGYVTPEFSSNDKTPSWDGSIRLYTNEDSDAKDNLFKIIPVQIKGHYQKSPYSELISFNIEVADLNNYLNHNGAIFFVIYVDENGAYKIYYDTLTPLKIRRILKGRESQKTISIHLQSFPENNKKEAVDIFFTFTLDMEMQLPKNDITLEDVFKRKVPGFDTFNISYRGIKYKNDPFEYFLSHPTTVSLKNSYTGIAFLVDTIFLQSIGSKHNEPICIAGIKYYDSFETIRQKDKNLILKFGKSFTYNLQVFDNVIKGNFHYDIKGNLAERIKDTRFILAYLKHKEFEIGAHKGFHLTDEQIKAVDIQYFENNLHLLEKIDELLNKLKITTTLDYDKISAKNEKTFVELINTILLGATCIPENPDMLYKIQLANISILLVANKIDDSHYKIINYFSDENKIQCAFSYKEKSSDEKMFIISKTFILKENDFCSLDNIDYDMVYKDITESQTSDELKEYTYYFMQEMIEGYSKRTKDKDNLFNCIKESLKFLNETVEEYDFKMLKNNLRQTVN